MNNVHHPLSPSSYPAWEQCPHWERGTTSEMKEAAAIGTRQHALLARALMKEVDLDEVDEDNDIVIPVRRAVRGITQFVEQELPGAADNVIECERRLSASSDFPQNPFGTADVLVHRKIGCVTDGKNHLLAIDYKSRYTNKTYWEQLAFYAYAMMRRCPMLDYATLAVWYGDEATIETMDVSKERAYAMALHAIANRLNREQMGRHASPWCSLCKHCATCKQAFSLVEKAYSVLPPRADETTIDETKLADMLAVAGEVKHRIYALDEYARQYALDNGGTIMDKDGKPRYFLKEIRLSKLNLQPFFNAVRSYVTAADVLGASKLTKQAARDLLKGRTNAEGHALSKKEIDAIIEGASTPDEPGYRMTKVKQ